MADFPNSISVSQQMVSTNTPPKSPLMETIKQIPTIDRNDYCRMYKNINNISVVILAHKSAGAQTAVFFTNSIFQKIKKKFDSSEKFEKLIITVPQ